MSVRVLARYTEVAYALLRIVAGLSLATHGAQKLFGALGGQRVPVGSQLWLGGVIELVAGTLIAVGLLTPWAALLASGTMAVAYLQFHWKLQAGPGFFPVVNKGELALIYCLLFFFIACRGGGPWSADARRRLR